MDVRDEENASRSGRRDKLTAQQLTAYVHRKYNRSRTMLASVCARCPGLGRTAWRCKTVSYSHARDEAASSG